MSVESEFSSEHLLQILRKLAHYYMNYRTDATICFASNLLRLPICFWCTCPESSHACLWGEA